MSFIITGDTHGTLDIGKVVTYFAGREDEFSEDDYLIICGDVGACGFSASVEAEARRIFRNLPVTVLFVDGNHENFEQLNGYPVEEWKGGKVHFIENNLIHLMRGQVFDIDGTTFFTFGGAHSIDRAFRAEGVSWFPEEIPNYEEYEEGLANLEAHGNAVDYILTHTAPYDVAGAMGYGDYAEEEGALRKYLQQIADEVEFKDWYFGHFHEDCDVEEVFHCLYDEVVRL